MRKVLVALAILAMSTEASAAEWWWTATTKDRAVIFVDRDSVANVAGAKRSLTMATTQVIDGSGKGGAPRQVVSYFECNGRYAGDGSRIFNDPTGAAPTPAMAADAEAKLGPATPGSGDTEKMKFACNAKRVIPGETQFSIQGSDFFGGVTDPEVSAKVYQSNFDKVR